MLSIRLPLRPLAGVEHSSIPEKKPESASPPETSTISGPSSAAFACRKRVHVELEALFYSQVVGLLQDIGLQYGIRPLNILDIRRQSHKGWVSLCSGPAQSVSDKNLCTTMMLSHSVQSQPEMVCYTGERR